MTDHLRHLGDADLSVVGAALGDPRRSRMLLAVMDGRALPASVLASEAGVSPSTASAHLDKLCSAGLLRQEVHGRFRYYRLAGNDVADALEAVARLSPLQPVRSLSEGTRAHAVRLARRCYDHLAGRLGVAVTAALVAERALEPAATTCDTAREAGGRLSGGVRSGVAYVLTGTGRELLMALGARLPAGDGVACCIDWSEQRPHVAGPVGRSLLEALVRQGWLEPSPSSRALRITECGEAALTDCLGITWPLPHGSDAVSDAGLTVGRRCDVV